MSDAAPEWAPAAEARTGWRRADDALNYLRAVHATLSDLHDSLTRNTPSDAGVEDALAAVDRLETLDSAALAFLTEPVMPEDRTFAGEFRTGRAVTPGADAVATALSGYAGGGEFGPVQTSLLDVLDQPQGSMAIDTTTLHQLVVLFGLAVEAAIRYRESQEDALQTALEEAYDAVDEPLPSMDDQPLALLPVRLETRFVDGSGGTEGRLRELLVRVYPDQIHTDTHEAELTRKEVVWGQNFWATLWFAKHETLGYVGDDPTSQYLESRLPNARLRERVAGIDPSRFSDDAAKRYAELKERAWQQLLDRFDRERAAYVVHALEPTDEDLAHDLLTEPKPAWGIALGDGSGDEEDEEFDLSDSIGADADLPDEGGGAGVGSGIVDSEVPEVGPDFAGPTYPDLQMELPPIEFPEVPRRPESWTKQARARLLPDRWIAVAEWEDHTGETQRTAVASDAVREPLPVGPSAESVAADELDEASRTDTVAPDGNEWMVDFQEAEDAGMALRVPLDGLAGFDPKRGFDRVSVVGVRASEEATETPDALADLLAAHHYTDGLEFLPQGTPTNNHDGSAGNGENGPSGLSVECVPPLIETGDRTDGDLLARALSIDPDEGEDHVFANVANADGTEQRDARHANSALWPATLGYSLEHLFVDNEVAGNPSLWDGIDALSGSAPGGATSPDRERLEESTLWLDAYRRHFVRYVRARGPFPAMRVGNQPYGILPAAAIETERDLSLIDPDLVADIGAGNLDVAGIESRGTTVQELAANGVEPTKLLEAGGDPEELLAGGADPRRLVSGGVDPESVFDATGLAPDALVQDGIGVRSTSRLTKDRLEAAGVPVEDLERAGITTRAMARGEVTDQQLREAGVTTEQLADVLLPRQAKELGLTSGELERAGITPATLLNGEFTPEQVERLGLTTRAVADAALPPELRELGITPKTLEDAEVTPEELLNGEVSPAALQEAGVETETIAAALLPPEAEQFGVTPESIAGGDVTVAELFNGEVSVEKLERAGLDTQTLVDALISDSFQEAGITPESLESAGITPEAVMNGQVTPDDLVEAGLTPRALEEAGVLPEALADVGETIGELLDAGLEPGTLIERGLTPQTLVDAGVTPDLLVEAGLAPKELVDAGVDAMELAVRGAGSVDELLAADVSPTDLARAGTTIADLASGDVPAKELVKTGADALELVGQGVDALGLAEGGARPSSLREATVDAGTLRDADKAAGSLRIAGYSAEELLDAGYTAEELLNGGFDRQELSAAGVSQEQLRGGARDVSTMLAAGHAPADLRAAGYAADELLEAGTAETLVDAGYTAGELVDAGVAVDRLVEAGLGVDQLRAADVTVDELLQAEVTPERLREAGATASELLEAGLTPERLLEAGFRRVELDAAGVDVDALTDEAAAGDLDREGAVEAAIEGLPYAATVLEDPEQAERDSYRFSFDPAVPTGPAGRTGASEPGVEDDEDTTADGGVMGGVPVVRPLSIDDMLPARLERHVSGFGTHWSAAAEGLPFDGTLDEGGLLNALERQGVATNLRQRTMLYSGEQVPNATDGVSDIVRTYLLKDHQASLRSVLETAELTDFDPRLGFFYPTDAGGDQVPTILESSDAATMPLSYFYSYHLSQPTQGSIEEHDVVDPDVSQFVDVLLGSSFDEANALGDVIHPASAGIDVSPLDVDQEEWNGFDVETKRFRIVQAIETASDPVQLAVDLVDWGDNKIMQLAQNQQDYGDSGVLRSLVRVLLQHGLLQEYLAARRRLGLAFDDLPSPWTEAASAPGNADTPFDTLWDDVPKGLHAHPDVGRGVTYREALTDAAAAYTSTTSIDPRLSEFTDSVQYLGGVDPDELSTLVRETLELSSYRLDAWWTSLATKQLLEFREAQGTVTPEGEIDHEAWDGSGGDVPRATTDPALLGSLSEGATGLETTALEGMAGGGFEAAGFEPATGESDASEEPTTAEGKSDASDASTLRTFDPATMPSLDVDAGGTSGDDIPTDGGVGPNWAPDDAADSIEGGGDRKGGSDQNRGSDQNGEDDEGIGAGAIDVGFEEELGGVEGIANRGGTIDPGSIDDAVSTDPGLYAGGYGFVENLSADVEGRDEPEYIHAPSEQQATTAAILKSGADAHDADEGENVMALSLSADRVRAGLRLLRGVRRGQSLGELLGYRFERRIQEATVDTAKPDLMTYAPTFRAEFPGSVGSVERPDENDVEGKDERLDELATREPVDGLAVVRNWDTYPFEREDELPDRGSPAYDELASIVSSIEADLDAVGDLLTAESVHQVGQGNFDRAGGSIGALAKGDQLPDPDVIETPRTETGLTHRQCVLCGEVSAPTATPRDEAAPSLSAWIETLLPDLGDVECPATFRYTSETTDGNGQPVTVDATESTTVTLNTLGLGALDVLLLFGADREETRSELEQRLVYHLIRERPPAVPADATVELTLTETDSDTAVSVAELLELCRSVREFVQSARPADATDLAHPGDAQDEGYDQATVDALTARANDAQDALFGVATTIDERIAVLDGSHSVGDGIDGIPTPAQSQISGDVPAGSSWLNLDGPVFLPPEKSPAIDYAAPDVPALPEQVTSLAEASRSVAKTVPLSTVESIASAVDPGAVRQELGLLLDDLPAGSASPRAADADHTVEAGPGQSISGRLGEPVAVPDVSTDGGEGDDDTDDGVGAEPSDMPTAWAGAPQEMEAGIMGVSTTDAETVPMDDLAELDVTDQQYFADELDTVTIDTEFDSPVFEFEDGDGSGAGDDSDDPGAGDDGDDTGTGDDTDGGTDWSTATATIRAWGTDGLSWFEIEETTTPAADGSFEVPFDFSAVEAGTSFQVVAIVDGATVYSATGRVVTDDTVTGDAQSTLRSDCNSLQELLWLRDRKPLLSLSEGPSARFATAHDGVRDWQAIRDERDAADPATSTVTNNDIDAIDDLLGLETLDPKGVPNGVDGTTAPVSALGLDRIVDVTDGEGGPATGSYWLGATRELGSVRARITRTLSNPVLFNANAAPWLLKYDHRAGAILHGLEDGETAAAYLDAFLAQPAWTLRYLDRELSDPSTLLQELTAWLYHPAELDSESQFATALGDLAAVVAELPALEALFDGLPTGSADSRREAFATHLQSIAGAIGASVSLPAVTQAETNFDTKVSEAAGSLEIDAGIERAAVEQLGVDPTAEAAFRNVVLERLREPMTVAASYGVFGATPGEPDGGTPDDAAALLEQARALLERLRGHLTDAAGLDPRIESGLTQQPIPQQVEAQADRLERLFGDGFTVLPPFSPTNAAELAATFTDDGLVPDEGELAAETWLQRTAAHRERVGLFREARSYAEALAGTLSPPLRIGQVPFEPGETWVGVDGVDPEPGRVSLVAQFGPGASAATAGDRLAGLFVDEFNEAIPAETETTGVALNYDDPGNRPPQSILLVPPPDDEWSLDYLAATVAETSAYMKRRAVDLGDLDEALTALFPALNFAQGEATGKPTVEFGMLDWYDLKLDASLVLGQGPMFFDGDDGGDSE